MPPDIAAVEEDMPLNSAGRPMQKDATMPVSIELDGWDNFCCRDLSNAAVLQSSALHSTFLGEAAGLVAAG